MQQLYLVEGQNQFDRAKAFWALLIAWRLIYAKNPFDKFKVFSYAIK